MADVLQNEIGSGTTGRRLGGNESLYAHLMEVGGGSLVYQVGVIESSQGLSLDHFTEAARVLASRQEALRMRIVHSEPNNNFRFHFAPMEQWNEINVRLVSIKNKENWVNIVNEEGEELFDCEKGPLWKITIGKVDRSESRDKYIVILKIHHAICDGKSAFDMLYRQYLPMLSAIVNKEDPGMVIAEDIPLHIPCENSFENTHMPWYLRAAINAYRWYAKHFVTPPEHVYRYESDPKKTPEEIQAEPEFYPHIFNKDKTANIVEAAKTNGVSVHTVFISVCSIALSALCQEAGIKIAKNIHQGWTIDMRKFLDWKSPQPLCAYHSIAITTTVNKHDYNVEEFWALCKTISKNVKASNTIQKSAPGMSFATYFMEEGEKVGSVTDVMKVFGSAASCNISNLGVCDIGVEPRMSQGDVSIILQEHYFGVSGMRNANMLPFYHYMSTFKGKLMWNLCYNPKKVSKRFVENYMGKINEMFEKYCSFKF